MCETCQQSGFLHLDFASRAVNAEAAALGGIAQDNLDALTLEIENAFALHSSGIAGFQFLESRSMDNGAKHRINDGINAACEPDFKFRAIHFRFQIRFQIGGILQFNVCVTVGDQSHLPSVIDFDLPNVGVFKDGLLHQGHVDGFLAGNKATDCCTKDK
jgi:hypothetical protein